MKREIAVVAILLAVTIILLYAFPYKREAVINTSWSFFVEMMLILPAVMVMLGLFAVFVPQKAVVKYLGVTSGMKGAILSLAFGALPTGPLYVAFPIAASLLEKGARVSNIIIFLSAWACIKIPQEMVELQFLGAKFTLLRLSLTVIFVVFMGFVIEKIVGNDCSGC